MGDKMKFIMAFLLGAILLNFVPCVNSYSYPTVSFPTNMIENDVVDIKGVSSQWPTPFRAELFNQNNQFVMGVYVLAARGQMALRPSKRKFPHRSFGKGKPFRIVLRLHNGEMDVHVLDVQDSKYQIVDTTEKLNDKNVAMVRMRGNFTNGDIRKGRWIDYVGLPTDCGHLQSTRPILQGLCEPVNPENNERITEGLTAEAGAHPWQVSIWNLEQVQNRFKHICGGVLIGNCWILTAAHCFDEPWRPEVYRVRVGDYYNGEGKQNAQYSAYEDSQDVPVKKVIYHGSYWTTPSTRNDIALVRLKNVNSDGTCVRFGDFVQPVCLPRSDDEFSHSDCVITGWGASQAGQATDEYPSCLQQASVSLITNQQCKLGRMGYSNNGDGDRILDTMVCAEGIRRTGGKLTDACQGDSGGPLVCSEGVNASTVWGITSWGEGCGTHYGVYTKIFRFRSWITAALLKYYKYDPFS